MNNDLSPNGAAIYSIQIQGILDQHWTRRFGDMQVHTAHTGEGSRPPVTTVVGEVADQAALAGLLDLAYSLGMPLLSVTYLGRP